MPIIRDRSSEIQIASGKVANSFDRIKSSAWRKRSRWKKISRDPNFPDDPDDPSGGIFWPVVPFRRKNAKSSVATRRDPNRK